jgi:S-methylmethionine-dependent homocysteine/selenocysteine methylase
LIPYDPVVENVILLDGPMGTELLARGVATPLPGWSAHALDTAPEVVAAIHRDYAKAGAQVHTANTFRTQPRWFPDRWRALIKRAVEIAREALGGFNCRLAGSMSPLEDCYSPELSPADPRPEHRQMARALADEGVDLLLVETFPHVGEALIAAEEAIATGLPTWLAFTAGPTADLLTPAQVREGARHAVHLGVEAVLVNCTPTPRILEYLLPLGDLGVTLGAYANAGRAEAGMGFAATTLDIQAYAEAAEQWVEAGARIVGGCCGTGVAHLEALRRRLA